MMSRSLRKNIGEKGTVFVLNTTENPDELGWVPVAPTAYQQNSMGISRKFVLGTKSGLSRGDLVLKLSAMPRPIFIRPYTFEWNCVEVPPPSTWASLHSNPDAAEFDVEVDLLDVINIRILPTPTVRK